MAGGAFASLAFQSWVMSTCLEKANGKHTKLSILCSQAILRNCYSVFRLLPGPIDITDLKDGRIVDPLFAAKQFWWTGLRHGEIQAFIKASSGRMWRTNWNVTEPHMGVHVWLNPIPDCSDYSDAFLFYQIMFSQKDLCISQGFANWISSFHDFLYSLAFGEAVLSSRIQYNRNSNCTCNHRDGDFNSLPKGQSMHKLFDLLEDHGSIGWITSEVRLKQNGLKYPSHSNTQ